MSQLARAISFCKAARVHQRDHLELRHGRNLTVQRNTHVASLAKGNANCFGRDQHNPRAVVSGCVRNGLTHIRVRKEYGCFSGAAVAGPTAYELSRVRVGILDPRPQRMTPDTNEVRIARSAMVLRWRVRALRCFGSTIDRIENERGASVTDNVPWSASLLPMNESTSGPRWQ